MGLPRMHALNPILLAILFVLVGLLWLVIRHQDLLSRAKLGRALIFVFVWGLFSIVIRGCIEPVAVRLLTDLPDLRYPDYVIWAWVLNCLILTAAAPVGGWYFRRCLSLPLPDCIVVSWVVAVPPQLIELAVVITPFGWQFIWR